MLGDNVRCYGCGRAMAEGTPDTMSFLMDNGIHISYCPACRQRLIYKLASRKLILQFAAQGDYTPEEIIKKVIDMSVEHNDPFPAQIVGEEIEHLLTEGVIGVNSRNDGTVYIISQVQGGII